MPPSRVEVLAIVSSATLPPHLLRSGSPIPPVVGQVLGHFAGMPSFRSAISLGKAGMRWKDMPLAGVAVVRQLAVEGRAWAKALARLAVEQLVIRAMLLVTSVETVVVRPALERTVFSLSTAVGNIWLLVLGSAELSIGARLSTVSAKANELTSPVRLQARIEKVSHAVAAVPVSGGLGSFVPGASWPHAHHDLLPPTLRPAVALTISLHESPSARFPTIPAGLADLSCGAASLPLNSCCRPSLLHSFWVPLHQMTYLHFSSHLPPAQPVAAGNASDREPGWLAALVGGPQCPLCAPPLQG
jgi:hypothetical protein